MCTKKPGKKVSESEKKEHVARPEGLRSYGRCLKLNGCCGGFHGLQSLTNLLDVKNWPVPGMI